MINQEYHATETNGAPCGGACYGDGFAISWQNGPLVVDGENIGQNGAFVEDIISAAKGRLEYFQTTKFKHQSNKEAIDLLDKALDALASRTADRQARGVEGTHEV